MEAIATILGAAVAAWLATSLVSSTNMEPGAKSIINIIILIIALIVVLAVLF